MMFLRQKHYGSGKNISKDQIMTFLPFEETKEEIRTRAAHDLLKLLHLKTEQVKIYRTALIPQSNLYMRYQIVQSFLWMQSRQHVDNPRVKQCDLAAMVTQRFNRK